MESIASILLDWYGRAGRDLPWRRTRDPYRIWISEVVLQQTRVAQGTDYYLRFTERFPDVESLAAASEDEVLRMWQGLGYYSRARNLHAAARAVVAGHGGRFPASYEDRAGAAGRGEYTAAAVCSAAFGLPVAAVDGNVLRVVSRLFDVAGARGCRGGAACGDRTGAGAARRAASRRLQSGDDGFRRHVLHARTARLCGVPAGGALPGAGRGHGDAATRQARPRDGERPVVRLPAHNVRRPHPPAAPGCGRHLAGALRVSARRGATARSTSPGSPRAMRSGCGRAGCGA